MESEEDPLLTKFLISSLEYEKLKYFETKYRELTLLVEKLKLENSEQTGRGNYVVESNSLNKLETPTLEETDKDSSKPLINYSVPIVKNDDNDDFDENALLHLIPEKNKLNAKCLLQKIDTRGSEITWNSSGTVFIDNVSIPNSNVFLIYPHLFQKCLPKREIPGLKEFIKKLDDMGLKKFTCVSIHCKNSDAFNSLTETIATDMDQSVGLGQSTLQETSQSSPIIETNRLDETNAKLQSDAENNHWYYLG